MNEGPAADYVGARYRRWLRFAVARIYPGLEPMTYAVAIALLAVLGTAFWFAYWRLPGAM
ncbi:MAG TPA: hypothetical protein VGC74_15055 [Stenotrophomonas sp.]|jgi:hypothetical protein